jgi:hypothetical protein
MDLKFGKRNENLVEEKFKMAIVQEPHKWKFFEIYLKVWLR